MNTEKVVLLLTACVAPPTEMICTNVTDSEERKQRYVFCLQWYISNSQFNKIVFCDNSDCEPFPGVFEYAEKNNKKLEFLHFKGDNEKSKKYGKGYGDGEIINYAIENSKLISESVFFIKVSGRYLFANIDEIFNFSKNKDFYYRVSLTKHNIFKKNKSTMVNTVIFASKIQCFSTYFADAYLKTNDRKGIFYEHVFTGILLENKKHHWFSTYRMTNLPDYSGNKSGTLGVNYKKTNVLKKIVKKLLNFFNFFQI